MAIRRVLTALAAIALSTTGSAQTPAARTAAALVVAEGVVYLDDKSIAPSAVPLALPGDVVVRTAASRAAIELKRGGWLFLEAGSSVRVFANGVYNFNRLEVLSGSAVVVSATSAPLVDCESEIRLSSGGIFRFDAQPTNAQGERPCQFKVYDGAVAVPLTSVTNALRAGQSMTCNRRCGDMIPTREFSLSELDAFDQWVRRMHQALAR